ncbi:TetR/AcrR family transcriptional regulator [Streptomyces sp. AN091965]|uniref:TetR/AcrR family transcriptional regulator n=1 Tax=Streptomyces sp. AN091965 TaxID=2927803 RepID=UPI001F60A0C4|nr:TetR/AcrR family transcriptional regulator [Streptomyces sp. AN091965]MCI3933095.1 TetR/AcrR family transcriptional regulator [Streptomyces sp. AN091965]
MAEGLRERKKRQTKQRISDIATGLFLERGFAAVTVADVAEAADVSVNTVYNYFPAKEDLFLDRGADMADRLSRWVRGRRTGESAADAVLRELRGLVEGVSPAVGLFAGYADFMRVITDSPALRSRLWAFQQESLRDLEGTLRAEAGPGGHLPDLVAGQLHWLHAGVLAWIGAEMVERRDPCEVSREALVLIDEMEDLLGERVLNYAVREAS